MIPTYGILQTASTTTIGPPYLKNRSGSDTQYTQAWVWRADSSLPDRVQATFGLYPYPPNASYTSWGILARPGDSPHRVGSGLKTLSKSSQQHTDSKCHTWNSTRKWPLRTKWGIYTTRAWRSASTELIWSTQCSCRRVARCLKYSRGDTCGTITRAASIPAWGTAFMSRRAESTNIATSINGASCATENPSSTSRIRIEQSSGSASSTSSSISQNSTSDSLAVVSRSNEMAPFTEYPVLHPTHLNYINERNQRNERNESIQPKTNRYMYPLGISGQDEGYIY